MVVDGHPAQDQPQEVRAPLVGHGDLGRLHRLPVAPDRQFLLSPAGSPARHRDLQDHFCLLVHLQDEASAHPARMVIHAPSLSRRCPKEVP